MYLSLAEGIPPDFGSGFAGPAGSKAGLGAAGISKPGGPKRNILR
jgi:hypothetical protein